MAAERLEQYIRENNLRPSPVRMIVLEQACRLEQPFTARQLETVCAEDRISTGTVYNTLNVLVAAQILHATTRQRGRTATEYELTFGNHSRLQIICEKCRRVSDFRDKAIERLVEERRYSNFNLQRFSLFVYGECKRCRGSRKTMKQ